MDIDDLPDAYARALGAAPDVTAAAVSAFDQARHHRVAIGLRLLLAACGVIGIGLATITIPREGIHVADELAGLQAALALGFLVAAWRPQRYAVGLTPVALTAAVVLLLPTAGQAGSSGRLDGLSEAAHLPIVVGAAVLLLTTRLGALARRDHG